MNEFSPIDFISGIVLTAGVILFLWHACESDCQSRNNVADCVFSGFVPAVPEKDHPNGQ